MGMRDEIANLKSVCCGLISRDEVLDIVDKHAVPVVDMTPGMQPKRSDGAWLVECMLDGMGGEREKLQADAVVRRNAIPQTEGGDPDVPSSHVRSSAARE